MLIETEYQLIFFESALMKHWKKIFFSRELSEIIAKSYSLILLQQNFNPLHLLKHAGRGDFYMNTV
jgi:hypothetical protein